MLKAIIVDDEPLARSILLEYLNEHPEITVVQECNNGFEGVKSIMQLRPDVLFLDIQMPKINGFEMLELLDYMPHVVFTTAFDEYAMKAFEANAIDYLLKPISKDRFTKAVQKLKSQPQEQYTGQLTELVENVPKSSEDAYRIVVKAGSNIRIVPIAEVQYLEAYDDYVKIHTKEGVYVKKKTMAFYEDVLDPQQFVRIHRSYIIHLQLITKIEVLEKDSHVVLLTNGMRLPVSKSGYVRLKEVLGI